MSTPDSSDLWIRKAILTVDTLQIDALDIAFTVKKDLKAKPNTADIKVYNLSADHRSQLAQLVTAPVQLEVGYQKATSVIFIGDLRTSLPSDWTGSDVVTTITSGDGAKKHKTARINVSHAKGAKSTDVLNSLVQALGVAPGNSAKAISAIGSSGVGDCFSLGTVLCGSAAREMSRVCRSVGYTWSIQNGALQMLPLKAALAGTAVSVTPQTGLIGSPSVDKDGIISCKTLILPDLFPGRLMVLTSNEFSGQFTITETTHTGETKGQNWYCEIKGKRY